MTEFLFVYGTLRSEFPHPLAKRLSTQAKFVGKGSTPGLLYDFGWYPGAKFDPHARTHVIGEVFSLKNAERLLAELDREFGRGTRAIVEFRNFGMRWEEVAAAVGWCERTCRSRYQSAYEWLEQRMSPQPEKGESRD